MSRKIDNLSRLFNELKDRYGEADPVVAELRLELDALKAFEFRYQESSSFSRQETGGLGTCRPYNDLFGTPKSVRRNVSVSRLLSLS